MINEKDEIELLKFWLDNFQNISKIPEHLKSKISENDVVKLLATMPKDNLLESIKARLETVQNKILRMEELEIQKKSNSLRYMWKTFLFFGFFIVIINTLINTVVTFKVNEILQGPTCRIDTSNNIFSWNKSTNFNLAFGVINLRNQKVILNQAQANCYWAPLQQQQNQNGTSSSTTSYYGTYVPNFPPQAPPKPTTIEELGGSPINLGGCRAPDTIGQYTITISASLSSGTCSKDITMVVN